MKNITGPPVKDGDFFGREKEIPYVWNQIKDGNNYILPSPRRVGKTSFALKLLDLAYKKDWKTIHINLEKFSELEALENFAQQLIKLSTKAGIKEKGKSVLEFIGRFKPTASVGGVNLQLNWETQQKEVYSRVDELLDHDRPMLIFFDELTVLLSKMAKKANGIDKVSDFLHWLRGIRVTPESKIRWVFCSSVGIENFAHTHNLSETINDTTEYFLEQFDCETSEKMLQQLAKDQKIELPEDVVKKIIKKLDDCIPFFLQIIFGKIHSYHKVNSKEINAKLVDEAYQAILNENHFNTWIERIKEQYNDREVFAFLLLRHLCQESKGSTRSTLMNVLSEKVSDPDAAEDLLSALLYMLKNDGYLIETKGKYSFRSPLLRDFWHQRFVK
jgi:AAA+ ATPase superfamily predicted ATPase